MFSISFRSDFKILSFLQLVLDFINQIYLRIRLDLIFIFRTFNSYMYFLFLVFVNSHDKSAVKHFCYEILKNHLK